MVSIIIPTYNRAHFLKTALDSVLNQSFRDFEVTVIDDGSTDGTQELVRSYREPIKYIPISHSGVSRARNIGIKMAEGEWISFLDSDDYWLPQKLKRQILFLKENPGYRICHTDEIWIKNGIRINQGKKHKRYSGWFFLPSLHLCLISPSTVMIKRDTFDKVGMFNESLEFVEDYDLWLRISCHFPVGYIEEKLVVKVGGHGDQLSKKIEGIEKYRILALENFLLKDALNEGYLREAVEVYKKKCQIYMGGCKKRGRVSELEELKSRMKQVLSKLEKSDFKCCNVKGKREPL